MRLARNDNLVIASDRARDLFETNSLFRVATAPWMGEVMINYRGWRYREEGVLEAKLTRYGTKNGPLKLVSKWTVLCAVTFENTLFSKAHSVLNHNLPSRESAVTPAD